MSGVALVTGAGVRIGRALSLELAAMGYDIAIHYRSSQEEARALANEVEQLGKKTTLVQADLAREDDVSKIIATAREALGPITLLINNASVFEDDSVASMSRRSWDKHIETNLRAPIKLAQDFAAQAPKDANANIINIIDQRVLKPTPRFFSYALSKSALYAATTTLAQALGPDGIRVNAIAPGPILRNARQSEEDWQRQNEATILGQGANPDAICGGVRYLVNATAVTGEMISIDGGQRLTWQTPDATVGE